MILHRFTIPQASWRVKLLALSTVPGVPGVGDLRVAWGGLSGACHQHAYELSPTAGEVGQADKGSRFERMMAAFLATDPTYAEQFADIWLWQDWPGRDGKHDTGIDLVATDRLSGELVAIQCKFYDPKHAIAKPDIDSFLSASGHGTLS